MVYLIQLAFCFLSEREARLRQDHGRRKSETMIPLLLPLGRKIPWPSKVHTFRRPQFVEKVFSLYVILIIGCQLGPPTTQSSGYSLCKINSSSLNSTK